MNLNHELHLALGLSYREDDKYGPMYFAPQDSLALYWDSQPKDYTHSWVLTGPLIQKHFVSLVFHDGTWTGVSLTDQGRTLNRSELCETALIAAVKCLIVTLTP